MAEHLVLLVDDNADTLDLYAEYLTFHGYAVVVACHGQESITVARAKRPAVVFLDIEMPGLMASTCCLPRRAIALQRSGVGGSVRHPLQNTIRYNGSSLQCVCDPVRQNLERWRRTGVLF